MKIHTYHNNNAKKFQEKIISMYDFWYFIILTLKKILLGPSHLKIFLTGTQY